MMDSYLRHRARPGEGELSGWLVVPEEHIGYTFAFRSGQPRREERIGLTQNISDDHGAARQQDGDNGNARPFHIVNGTNVFRREREIGTVSLHLGVGGFAYHNNANGRSLGPASILRVGYLGDS